MVSFIKLGMLHRERTGRADDPKREAKCSGGAWTARVRVHKRVARRVRVRERNEVRRGGNDEGGEREGRAH
jgi:hypothetical protein